MTASITAGAIVDPVAPAAREDAVDQAIVMAAIVGRPEVAATEERPLEMEGSIRSILKGDVLFLLCPLFTSLWRISK